MTFPFSKPWAAPQVTPTAAAVSIPPFVQEDTLVKYGSMPEFTRYALISAARNRLDYQREPGPVDSTVRWHDIAPVGTQSPTFAGKVEKAARNLPAQEPTEAGRRFLQHFLQACRERGVALDVDALAAAHVSPTRGDLHGGDIHSPSNERSAALVETLLNAIRAQDRVLPLGHADFQHALASYLPHMPRILQALVGQGVIPSALDWQLSDYTSRLARVAQICEREQLAGAEDFCRLFIAPEPNATVTRQQHDWDQRLAELAPVTSAGWQLRRRAAMALAPLLNPQVAQHLLAAMPAAGR